MTKRVEPLYGFLDNEYGVDVYLSSELGNYGCSDAALSYFAGEETAAFSAALIPIGTGLVILDNDNHAGTRRLASVAPEMAHVLLEHQFTVAILGPDGCRSIDPEIEAEAYWSGGELQITYAAAMMSLGATLLMPRLHGGMA